MASFEQLSKRPKVGPLSANEKTLILNCYNSLRNKMDSSSVDDTVELCATMLGVSKATVYKIKKEQKTGHLKSPKKSPGRPSFEIDDDLKQGLRRKVHDFFFKKEIPTLDKVFVSVQNDQDYPKMSRSRVWKFLKQIGFQWKKHSRKSILIDRHDIVTWRRNYLRSVRKAREENKKIYYLDETWLNEGHTVSKCWQDENIKNRRQAYEEGWSTGFNPPSGKGRRLIITHIGSSEGFLEGGLLTFDSKQSGDYHQDMNATVFEEWFSKILHFIPKSSIIVMDNASYHSRLRENLPSSAWRKNEILDWLVSKNIKVPENPVKNELLDLANIHKSNYKKYITDEMAASKGITVVRLPPYHCELNPIELIWAQVKGEVARKNTTFKMVDVKALFVEAVSHIKSDNWEKCVNHIIEEERKMWNLDQILDEVIEPIIINTNDSSSSEFESDVQMQIIGY